MRSGRFAGRGRGIDLLGDVIAVVIALIIIGAIIALSVWVLRRTILTNRDPLMVPGMRLAYGEVSEVSEVEYQPACAALLAARGEAIAPIAQVSAPVGATVLVASAPIAEPPTQAASFDR